MGSMQHAQPFGASFAAEQRTAPTAARLRGTRVPAGTCSAAVVLVDVLADVPAVGTGLLGTAPPPRGAPV